MRRSRRSLEYANDSTEMFDWDAYRANVQFIQRDYIDKQVCSLKAFTDVMLSKKCFIADLSRVFGVRQGKEHVGYLP